MTEYEHGFLTKCAEYGIDGRLLLKAAYNNGSGGRGLSSYDPRLIGGLGGAALGGLAGALIDRKKRWRGALIGALGGGAAGFGLGAQHRYLQNKSQLDAQSRAEMERNNARNARLARRGEIAAWRPRC